MQHLFEEGHPSCITVCTLRLVGRQPGQHHMACLDSGHEENSLLVTGGLRRFKHVQAPIPSSQLPTCKQPSPTANISKQGPQGSSWFIDGFNTRHPDLLFRSSSTVGVGTVQHGSSSVRTFDDAALFPPPVSGEASDEVPDQRAHRPLHTVPLDHGAPWRVSGWPTRPKNVPPHR